MALAGDSPRRQAALRHPHSTRGLLRRISPGASTRGVHSVCVHIEDCVFAEPAQNTHCILGGPPARAPFHSQQTRSNISRVWEEPSLARFLSPTKKTSTETGTLCRLKMCRGTLGTFCKTRPGSTGARTRTHGNTKPRPDPGPNTPKKTRRSATPSLRCVRFATTH